MCRQRICFWLSARGPEPLEAVLPRAGPSPGALSPAGSTGSGRCSESWSHSQLQDPPDSRPCSEKKYDRRIYSRVSCELIVHIFRQPTAETCYLVLNRSGYKRKYFNIIDQLTSNN